MKSNLAIRLLFPFLLLAFAVVGFADLYAQKLENPTKLYKGVVSLGTTGTAPEGVVYVYEEPYPTPVTSSKLNTGTGEYRVILDPAKLYRFSVEAVGCHAAEFIIASPAGTNYEELDKHFTVSPIPIDSVLFNGKLFAEGQATFSNEAKLREVLTFLVENQAVIVSIGVGLVKDEVDPISKQRVAAIKELFREMNVSTTRIKWVRMVGDELGLFKISIAEFDSAG